MAEQKPFSVQESLQSAMAGYVERLSRTKREQSSAALMCQRLAVFCIPYFLIVILGHRFGAIDTVPTFWLLALGVLMLIASLISGMRGFYELWAFGNKGGLSSAKGIVLASLLLLPFAYQGAKAFLTPPLYDISTDLEDPPAFDTALDDRTDVMNPVRSPTEISRATQLRAYPRLAARRYPLEAGRIFLAVASLVSERGWVILTSETVQGSAKIDEEGSGLVAKPVVDGRGRPLRLPMPTRRPTKFKLPSSTAEPTPFETVQVQPTGREENTSDEDQEERYIEALASSFLFGFESDVVIRIVEEEDGTLVDMRSTSRFGPHDLGSNAQRILSFMADLDTALQGLGVSG